MISRSELAELMNLPLFGERKMSKMINIKGKDISEDTIVAALKLHCGFTEEEPLKAGDVVRDEYGWIRIIVFGGNGKLIVCDTSGFVQSREGGISWKNYKKVGRLNELNNIVFSL